MLTAQQRVEIDMTTCACGNCQFFDTQSKAAKKAEREAGLCRYNPPLPQAEDETAVWPLVRSKDWCGHFAATVERFMTAAE
jgi:hypothetical protein